MTYLDGAHMVIELFQSLALIFIAISISHHTKFWRITCDWLSVIRRDVLDVRKTLFKYRLSSLSHDRVRQCQSKQRKKMETNND